MERLDQRLASDSPLSEVPTLAEYLPAWLRDLEGDQNTRRTYASHTQSHLILYLGEPMIAVLALIATRRAPRALGARRRCRRKRGTGGRTVA
jgi:hypothetical protein